MKTDDYKQELRLSASLHARNAKKIFLRSKSISKSPEKSLPIFSELPRKIAKSLERQIHAKKNGLLPEGRLVRMTTLLLVSMF